MVDTAAALRRLWTDSLTVTEYQKVTRPDKSTGFEEVDAISDEPCRLSFLTVQAAGQGETTAQVIQAVKLFCDPFLSVKPGSKVTVTHGGLLYEYAQSGLPAKYSSHQEIALAPWGGWV